jgi:hypothetical protein
VLGVAFGAGASASAQMRWRMRRRPWILLSGHVSPPLDREITLCRPHTPRCGSGAELGRTTRRRDSLHLVILVLRCHVVNHKSAISDARTARRDIIDFERRKQN